MPETEICHKNLIRNVKMYAAVVVVVVVVDAADGNLLSGTMWLDGSG